MPFSIPVNGAKVKNFCAPSVTYTRDVVCGCPHFFIDSWLKLLSYPLLV